ncbi:MAG: ankyrin repeat domain-containing protein [Alphaproteobacteria bacterium]|nr:ankyrin repeat domain-containing protein [Alphaproteobacteria bacterium]
MASTPFNNAAAPANDNAENLDRQLLRAAEFGETAKIIDLLAQGANINARHTNNDTPLHLAAREGYLETVKLLIEKKADTTLVNNFQRTALMESVREHQDEQINLVLINAGTPVNQQDGKGRTVAYFAAQDGLTLTTKALGDAGADFSLTGEDGVTPLIWATRLPGKHDTIDIITQYPTAGLDAQDEQGRTALMEAAVKNDQKLVDKYIGLNANVMRYDNDQKRARDLAQEYSAAESLKAIEAAEAAIYQPLARGVTGNVAAPATARFKPKQPVTE